MLNISWFINIIGTTFRLTTPLLLASLGGAFMHKIGKSNIAIEGIMLIGALSAYTFSLSSGNSLVGLLCGAVAGIIITSIYALFTLVLNADVFATGFTLVTFCTGVAAFVIRNFYGESGFLVNPNLPRLPVINIPQLSDLMILNSLINNTSILIPIALILTLVIHVIIYKTPYGFWLRTAGLNAAALEASGRNVKLVQYISYVISGALCGVAGAYLSIGYLNMFAMSIVAGRGFIALAIVFLTNGRPGAILLSSLLFGASEAFTTRIPDNIISPQISMLLPYVVTVIVLTISSLHRDKSTVTSKIRRNL